MRVFFLADLTEEMFLNTAILQITQLANNAIEKYGDIHIALSGGETPKHLYRLLRNIKTDWALWNFWFCDERCLPEGDPNLNYTMVMNEWLNFIPIIPKKIHRIDGFKGAEKAAKDYHQKLQNIRNFDITLLGLGDDGHTASLFPGNKAYDPLITIDVLPVHDAPKPPPNRVTLSVQRLNRSETILFLVRGCAKREIVSEFVKNTDMPATRIHPNNELWLLYCPD